LSAKKASPRKDIDDLMDKPSPEEEEDEEEIDPDGEEEVNVIGDTSDLIENH
jgi:hypothetical protein